jgi:hypothetical protein
MGSGRLMVAKINKITAHTSICVSGFLVVCIIAATHPPACANLGVIWPSCLAGLPGFSLLWILYHVQFFTQNDNRPA